MHLRRLLLRRRFQRSFNLRSAPLHSVVAPSLHRLSRHVTASAWLRRLAHARRRWLLLRMSSSASSSSPGMPRQPHLTSTPTSTPSSKASQGNRLSSFLSYLLSTCLHEHKTWLKIVSAKLLAARSFHWSLMNCETMLVWNVRGLNAGAHRDAVCELVVAERPSFVSLQKTKLSVISDFDVIQILGSGYYYTYLPVAGTRGGILVAWKSTVWSVTHIRPRTYSISARVKLHCDDSKMWLTTVYGRRATMRSRHSCRSYMSCERSAAVPGF